MARPKMSPSDRRSDQLNIALSPSERATIEDRAVRTGVSVTDFVRAAALSRPLKTARSNVPSFEVRHELRRIGNNLNQIARSVNAGRDLPERELAGLLQKLDTLFDDWLSDGSAYRQSRS
ncbi:plasmid mobilization relaxosome protein MobC [Henriciella sp.]|uniref:plasmid mobilization protein n=1 Tax=Henriciella sp. TaxID=1968823 RepID=UPI00345B94E1